MRLLERNKKTFICLLFWVVTAPTVEAAFEYRAGSVSSFAMAGAVDLHQAMPLDCYQHPALQPDGKLLVELSLARLYNIPDFTHASGLVLRNYRAVTIGLGSTQLTGSDFYWERSYLGFVSVGFRQRWRVGMSIDYQRIQFSGGYDDLDLVSLSLGLLATISRRLRVAATVRNINQPRYSPQSESTPRTGEVSLSHHLSRNIGLFLTYHVEEKMPDRLSFGQKLTILPEFSLRFGLRTEPVDLSGGFSLQIGRFFFDYGFTNNVYLGGTHKLGMRFAI